MYSHRYGTLPLVTRVGGLADTVISLSDDPDKANGFVIDAANTAALRRGIEGAIKAFHKKGSWVKMQHNAMHANYSWAESAAKYIVLYRELLSTP